jgi:hypothetical protein
MSMRTTPCCLNRVDTVFSGSAILVAVGTCFPSWWARESNQVNSAAVGMDHHSRYIWQGSFYQSHNIVQRIAVKQADTQTRAHTNKQTNKHSICNSAWRYIARIAEDFSLEMLITSTKKFWNFWNTFLITLLGFVICTRFRQNKSCFLNDDIATL